ncbi:hypothetical protein ACQPU1_08515 [Clostridium paraputrificum]|uniref:hypothetical protein n=1 Tax=Clostridium TaxID=1485 RepID=UPI003D357E5C
MSNISGVGILLSILVIGLFCVEGTLLIRAINKKKRLGIHLLGVIATLLISILTVLQSIGINIASPTLAIIAFILATLFFLVLSFDTLKV